MFEEVTSAAVAELTGAVERLAAVDFEACDGALLGTELLAVRRLIERLQAVWLRQAAAFDSSTVWQDDGAASAAAWIAARSNLTSEAALRRGIRTVTTLESLPATDTALAAGDISVEHAHQIATLADDALEAGAAAAHGPLLERGDEQRLLAAARGSDVRAFAPALRAWQDARDADAGVQRARRQHARRSLRTWTRPDDGMWCLHAELAPDAGEIATTAIEALRQQSRTAREQRSTEQQRADAFTTMCRAVLDGGELRSDGGERPQVSLVVDLATLRGDPGAAAARLGSGAAIDRRTARRLCCDADISRVITGPDGAILDLGRSRRTASKAQRRYLEVRDGGCVFPHCGTPPSFCQAHHLVFWSDHGTSDIDNLALLCFDHHHAVHEGGWQLTRLPATAGWRATRHTTTVHWAGPPQRHRPAATATHAGAPQPLPQAHDDKPRPAHHAGSAPHPTATRQSARRSPAPSRPPPARDGPAAERSHKPRREHASQRSMPLLE